jgi:hypothetical protein
MPSLGRQLAVNLDEVRKRAVANVDQTWTNGDGEVIEFPYEIEENEDLAGDSESGRYWDRTSDPCVVSAVPRKLATSASAPFTWPRLLFDGSWDVLALPRIALVRGTKREQGKLESNVNARCFDLPKSPPLRSESRTR